MIFKEAISFNEDRTVTLHYHNVPLTVPFWTKFLATDEDGEVWAFPGKPEPWQHTWQPVFGQENGTHDCCPVAIFEVPVDWTWQTTCVRYA